MQLSSRPDTLVAYTIVSRRRKANESWNPWDFVSGYISNDPASLQTCIKVLLETDWGGSSYPVEYKIATIRI